MKNGMPHDVHQSFLALLAKKLLFLPKLSINIRAFRGLVAMNGRLRENRLEDISWFSFHADGDY